MLKNQIFNGANHRKSVIDLTIPSTYSGKTILFVHGFMGFKDWGAWHLVEKYFTDLGFGFCKYNVSHNGCSPDDTLNFVDLEAFSENNYSKELEDLQAALDWMESHMKPFPELYLIGHSRGGGIVLLSHNDARIKKMATWAAISDIGIRFPADEELAKWKANGVRYQQNGRTNQAMPLHYSQYENFDENREKLDIKKSVQQIDKPLFLLHGDNDTSVSISEGEELSEWTHTPLEIIPGANHTFNSAHPWTSIELPKELKLACQKTAEFFLKSEK